MRLAAPCSTKKTARRLIASIRSHSVLGDIEQRPDLGYSRIVEQDVEPPPQLISAIEHALDVCRPGHIRLEGSLPELIGKGLCTFAIHIRQQQPRAFACQAPRRCSTDAARSARDEGMNACEAISHLADLFQGRRRESYYAALQPRRSSIHREPCEATANPF